MITINIDFDKIDQSRLFPGKKGRYLDLVLIETPNGQYGDFMVKQGSTKEEREAGKQMPILGNAKNYTTNQTRREQPPRTEAAKSKETASDVPF